MTEHVRCVLDGGHEVRPLVTFSFDEELHIRAVFCADFKAGTAMHQIVMDACVLMSRLLQHGVPPAEIAKTLAHPPSLIGSLAQAAAALDPADLLHRETGPS